MGALLNFALLLLRSVVLADSCDKYGWYSCTSDTDCAVTCDEPRKGQTWPGLSEQCQYTSYSCAVPSIPGCSSKRCLPDPVSAYVCANDDDCTSDTGEGDVCMDGLCVACTATPGWAVGGCNFTLGSNPSSQCAYSQHLLSGYDCPTGGRAPNGWMQAHHRDPGEEPQFLGLVAGCDENSVHPGGQCSDGNHDDGLKCTTEGIISRRQLGATLDQHGCCHDQCKPGTPQNQCGWDCRDGSKDGVQCGYDQPCLMITRDQTEVTLPMPHDMLTTQRNKVGNTYRLTEAAKDKLIRPTRCGGNDDLGMHCAADISRAIAEDLKTPEPLRARDMNVLVFWQRGVDDPGVSLSFTECPGQSLEDFNTNNCGSWGSLVEFGGGATVHVGTRVPDSVFENVGEAVTVGGTIATANGGKAYECRVKYSTTEPLHAAWGGHMDSGPNRSTLLVQACNTGWGHCGPWSASASDVPHTGGGCVIGGPDAVPPVPSVAQRAQLREAVFNLEDYKAAGGEHIFSMFESTWPALLRLGFHDAGTYSPDHSPGEMQGGANGCMRFEDSHNAAANMGIALMIELPHALAKRYLEEGGLPQEAVPWSAADMYQFMGVAAVAAMGGPDLTEEFHWGRYDAPYIWCQGEIQLAMPDFDGGHKKGWHKHGAGMIAERLQTSLDTLKKYFEERLFLQPKQWVALLGAHTVGKVAHTDSSGQKHPFDDTPDTFDNRYFRNLELFHDSARLSLCPQMRRPGNAHWWGVADDNSYTTLLDADVAMTVEGEYLKWVRRYAEDEQEFFSNFGDALLVTTLLGHDVSRLYLPGNEGGSGEAPTDVPTSAPTSAPSSAPAPCGDRAKAKQCRRILRRRKCKKAKNRRKCRKTCGACSGDGDSGACRDEEDAAYCRKVKHRNKCSTPFRAVNCQKTCGVC